MKPAKNGFLNNGKKVLAAGAVGVLEGFKRFLQTSNPPAREAAQSTVREGTEPETALPAEPALTPVSASQLSESHKAERNFSIKRTKSEVGYVYWILEGFGKYKCFVLCDSWDEAVAQAKARMAGIDAEAGEAAVGERASGVCA